MRADSQEQGGRPRQRARTRRLILEAALRLMHEGTIPSVEQAAAEADVSPATGYRYFPSRAALLRAAVEAAFPAAIERQLSGSSRERLEQVIETGFPRLIANEVFDRAVLRLALDQWLERRAGREPREQPVERPGRKPLVAAIIEPLEQSLAPQQLRRLELALAMILGIESYVALSDIYGVEPEEAQEVWRWTCTSLLDAALGG
jgi:AcrR family transcriptional regulator